MTRKNISLLTLLLVVYIVEKSYGYKVIYAVNCGGEEHTDSAGIKYSQDNLKVGTASDFGKSLSSIGRVNQADEIIYLFIICT